MSNIPDFKIQKLYSFVQECAKIHSIKFREYMQCTEMIIQKMCINVTCSSNG